MMVCELLMHSSESQLTQFEVVIRAFLLATRWIPEPFHLALVNDIDVRHEYQGPLLDELNLSVCKITGWVILTLGPGLLWQGIVSFQHELELDLVAPFASSIRLMVPLQLLGEGKQF